MFSFRANIWNQQFVQTSLSRQYDLQRFSFVYNYTSFIKSDVTSRTVYCKRIRLCFTLEHGCDAMRDYTPRMAVNSSVFTGNLPDLTVISIL